MRHSVLLVCLLWSFVVGCGEGTGDEVGYILVMPAARKFGASLEIDGKPHDTALPVEVSPLLSYPTIVKGGQNMDLHVRDGELVIVDGIDLPVERMRIRDTILQDQIVIVAPFAVAQRFAYGIGGDRPESLGMHEHWSITGRDVFYRSTWMGAQPEIGEFIPVPVEDSTRGNANDLLQPGPDSPISQRFGADLRDASGWVGIYESGPQRLILDAGGGFTLISENCNNLSGVFRFDERLTLETPDEAVTVEVDDDQHVVIVNGVRFNSREVL